MKKYVLVVETNAVKGTDSEFNSWYTHSHLADVLKLDGFTAAQRFKLIDSIPGVGSAPYRYMAIYECETQDIGGVIQKLMESNLPLSPSLDMNLVMRLYESICERKTTGD